MNWHRFFKQLILAVMCTCFMWVVLPVYGATIAVVVKRDIAEFNEHVSALKDLLEPSHSVLIEPLLVDDESETLERVMALQPDLVYTVGSKSTQAMVRGLPTNIPIVYGMVINAQHLSPRKLMVGRVLDVPMKTRLKILKELFPHVQRVGVIEGPHKRKAEMKRMYLRLSQELDLDIFVEDVGLRGGIQDILNKLFSQRVDVVVSTPTARIYNARDMRYLILFLSRYRVPYLALSPSYLDLGALLSIDADMDAEPKASQVLIERVLATPSLSGIPRLSQPSKVTYTINEDVLRTFRFRLSQSAIDHAKEMR